MAKVKVVLKPAGMAALLKSDDVGAFIEGIARGRAPSGSAVSRIVGRSRQNVRVADNSRGALDRDARTGHQSRVLGGRR